MVSAANFAYVGGLVLGSVAYAALGLEGVLLAVAGWFVPDALRLIGVRR